MIEYAAHNRNRLSRNLRCWTGALCLLFVVHFVLAAGDLRPDSPAESVPALEAVQQEQFEHPASYPAGSAARISEIRLASDRICERKSGTGSDVPPSEPSGIASDESRRVACAATDAATTAPHRPLYDIYRALLI